MFSMKSYAMCYVHLAKWKTYTSPQVLINYCLVSYKNAHWNYLHHFVIYLTSRFNLARYPVTGKLHILFQSIKRDQIQKGKLSPNLAINIHHLQNNGEDWNIKSCLILDWTSTTKPKPIWLLGRQIDSIMIATFKLL